MKSLVWGVALASLGVGAIQGGKQAETVVFVSGNLGGVLTPCGCTKPMSGGIRRRATAIREMGGKGARVVVDIGGIATGEGRQDEIKAETAAEAWKAMGIAAANVALSEAKLGPASVGSIARLAGEAAVCTSIADGSVEGVARWREAGPFLVGGLDALPAQVASSLETGHIEADRSLQDLIAEAGRRRKRPLLLFSGDTEAARALARRHPSLALVAHFSTARPESKLERVGKVALVSPGEQGRYLIRLVWDGSRFARVDAIDLGPAFADEAKVSAIYRNYQARVRAEKLLDGVPRAPSEGFAGTKTCGSCHSGAHEVWRKSAHAHALATLEKDGHDADPDCVGCHVVGLDCKGGFQARFKTPDLADVGCESCHGPGAKHSAKPEQVPMGKVGARSCMPCHNANASPNFDFEKYWARIRH